MGPDAAAEDGTAVDTTAEDDTAEDGTAEFSKKGGRYGGITWHSQYYGSYGGSIVADPTTMLFDVTIIITVLVVFSM